MRNLPIVLLLAGSLLIGSTSIQTKPGPVEKTSSRPARARAATPDVLYVRLAAIYAGKLPKGYDIPEQLLKEYGHTYEGRLVLLGHDWGDPLKAVGVIQKTKVKHDDERHQAYLEMTVKVTDPVAIRRIQRGTFKFVSIGFTSSKKVCSIDGKSSCFHRPGEAYQVQRVIGIPLLFPFNDVPARVNVKEICYFRPVDMVGQEVSFVNVPASRWARILEVSEKPLSID